MNHHRNFCAHQQPFPLTQKVEEAAMPGQPDARAFPISPGNSPSRITGLPLASPQSSFGFAQKVQRFR
jgi:hypothetical protein